MPSKRKPESVTVYLPSGHRWPGRIRFAAEWAGRTHAQWLRETVLTAVERAEREARREGFTLERALARAVETARQ